jgi:hypothetical protein
LAIFYVGQGAKNRELSHMGEALKKFDKDLEEKDKKVRIH